MQKKRGYKAKTIIGWREWCELEKLGLPGVAAKIDTGAKTSSLHAFKLKYIEKDSGTWVEFRVHPVQRHKQPEIHCRAKVVEMRSVVSSNGMAEKRPVIKTRIALGGHSYLTEITLSNRDEMGFRMLIGRQSLAPRFIVDASISWALGDFDENELYPETQHARLTSKEKTR